VTRTGRKPAQSTVEVALALPTLVLVVLLVLQSALYVHALHVVRSAAQEGARAAAADGASLATGEARARALLEAGLGRSGQALSVSPGEDADGVQVTVRGSLGLLVAGPVRALGLPLEAVGRATRESFVPTRSGT
jgi:TadE-like protein